MDRSCLTGLCCPECRNKLAVKSPSNKDGESYVLQCAGCRHDYPSINGIPELFLEWDPDKNIQHEPPAKYVMSRSILISLARENNISIAPCESNINPREFISYKYVAYFAMFRIFLWFLVGFGLFREVWAVGYILAGVSGFLLDFAVIKVLQKQQYKLQISQLVQNSNKNSLHEKYIKDSLTDTEEIDPEEVVNDRLSVIRGIIKNIPMHNKTVLHVGCGGKNDIEIAKAYEISGARNIGLDIHRPSIESFVRTFNTQGVIAEALNIPFSDNSFDIINATDIIEHVHDPARFLSESYRVLKNGGFLVIATPNRCRLRRNMEILNPFVFILNMIGTRFPMLLPQRELLAWHRNFSFFHTSFLYDELKELVVKAGFSVKYIRIKSYRGVLRPLRAYFEKVPLLNSLNDTVFVVAEK